jgi:hypothetical protein
MKKVLLILISILLFSISLKAQKDMSQEEWQRQMDSLILKKFILMEQLVGLDKYNDSIKIENKKLDSILGDKKSEMYKILGVSSYQVSEYKKKFWDLYNRIENRIGEYENLKEEFSEISESRIRLLYEFRRPSEKMKENLENFNK